MVFAEQNCAACGKGFRFPAEFGVVEYCSAVCRVTLRPPVHPWEYKGCTNSKFYNPRRRAIMTAGDCIDPLVVYLHFDWTCWLCDDKIDPAVKPPDQMCATIDHVVPLALGGSHTWDNVRPAHNGCGEKKGIDIVNNAYSACS